MTDTTEPLVILSLKAENFKRIKAIEITPDGEMVVLNGKNRQGKTSVLDGMWALFVGDSVVQADPIRHGEETAMVAANVGPSAGPVQFSVTRRFKVAKEKLDEAGQPVKGAKKYTTELIVASSDGARYPQPQKVLDGIMGVHSFDPKMFVDMPDVKKVDVLKRFVPAFDFAANLRTITTAMEDRKIAKRKAKDTHAQAAGIKVPEGTPETPLDEDALVAEMQKAGEFNTEIVNRQAGRDRVKAAEERAMAAAGERRAQAADLRKTAAAMDAQADACEIEAKGYAEKLAAAPPLPDPIDVSTITAQIAAARKVNADVAAAARRKELLHEAAGYDQTEILLDTKIEEARAAAKAAIRDAKLPVEGLDFTEDGVMLNGVPFEQASDEEQLSASVRIAAAMHPKLGIIRIRDGSLLDKESRKVLAEFAKANKLQVWMETVDETADVGILIEDGSVKSIDGIGIVTPEEVRAEQMENVR